MYKRQSAQANVDRSNGYKQTASAVKQSGHAKEHIFAGYHGGKVIPTGQDRKTDVEDPIYGNCSVKAPAGGKVQMLLQVTENVGVYWGTTHPMYLASQAQRAYYEDRHFNQEQNTTQLYEDACANVAILTKWLLNKNNFKQVLEYALLGNQNNRPEIANIVDMYKTNGDCAYITPGEKFIQSILDANPVPKQTKSGLRISVSIETGNKDKDGNPIRRSAFSFEVRSNATHCRGFLHKMEGGVVFPIVRKSAYCIKVDAPLKDQQSTY